MKIRTKGLLSSMLTCLWLVLLVSCTPEDPLDDGQRQIIQTTVNRVVTMAVSQETMPHSSIQTRTALLNTEIPQVVWSEGDQFRVISSDKGNVLMATLSAKSSGLGIKVGSAVSKVCIRYSDIKVIISNDGKETDVTSDITSQPKTTANSYMIGIYNSKGKYQYAPAGEGNFVEATPEGSGSSRSVSLVQSSSSSRMSSTYKATVTLKNIEFSTDNGASWTLLRESDIINPRSSKSQVTYSFTESGVDWTMLLSEGAGTSQALFKGTTPSEIDPYKQTLTVYPCEAFVGCQNEKLRLAIPQYQQYTKDSFDANANIMVGTLIQSEDVDYDVQFKNMCGILQLSLSGDCTLSEIKVRDRADNLLWGSALLPASDYQYGIGCNILSDGGSSVTLNCTGVQLTSTPTVFHIVVPVGAFSEGMEVTVTANDGRAQVFAASSSANVMGRNDLKQMPTIPVTNLVDYAEYNLENEAVQQYMSYGPYSKFGDTSWFTTYSSILNQSLCASQDDPAYVNITWNGAENENYYVTLTNKTTGRELFTDRVSTTPSYQFINLVPEQDYEFIVRDATKKKELRHGYFHTTGQVRMVTISDSWNYRDMGGWTGLGGKKVRYEWIYRGGHLDGVYHRSSSTIQEKDYQFTEACVQEIEDLGIKAELDLRGPRWATQQYNKSYGHTLIPLDVDYIDISTDMAIDSPLSDYAVVQDVAWIIHEVLERKRPVAFHCKSGADRTGAVGMILGALFGVQPGDVARDYELTTFTSETWNVRTAKSPSFRGFIQQGFTTLTPSSTSTNVPMMQAQAYWYLNQQFKDSSISISAKDLDAFIMFMLGMDETAYQTYRPVWAENYSHSLESLYESFLK